MADLVRFVLAELPPRPARVLEVGCGAGRLTRALGSAGYRVVGVDPHAPEGPWFRRVRIEELDADEPFAAAVATYALHHVESLERALDRVAALLEPAGRLVIEEFGWDRLDDATAAWYAHARGGQPVDVVLADWQVEHDGLHGYAAMRAALDARFTEELFEWRPYLYRSLKRDELEADERAAIACDRIRALGFRYVGARR